MASDIVSSPTNDSMKNSDSDSDSDLTVKPRKRIQRFNSKTDEDIEGPVIDLQPDSDSDDYTKNLRKNILTSPKSLSQKSVVHSNSDEESVRNNKYEEQKIRIKNKKNKMRDKFQMLLNSRDKVKETKKIYSEKSDDHGENSSDENTESDADESSISNIKKIIKEKNNLFKMSICDPDSSDSNDDSSNHKQVQKSKEQQNRLKLTLPKPQRISAKQAMENMQKIKSESNRMLREKEVTLPYHRPKALNLKDIMNRRKVALSSDGKALPIKMNEDQLRHYALQLEQRQKEVIELCKSDTEDEEPEDELEKVNNDSKENEKSLIGEILSDNVENYSSLPNQNDNISGIECKINSKPSVAQTLNNTGVYPKTNEADENIGMEANKSHTDSVQSGVENINSGNENISNKSVTENCYPNVTNDLSNDEVNDMSAEIELVYNDSAEDDDMNNLSNKNLFNSECSEDQTTTNTTVDIIDNCIIKLNLKQTTKNDLNNCSEKDSQLISLQYDTEINNLDQENSKDDKMDRTAFSDDDVDMCDINMEDIDNVIENAEIFNDGDSENIVKSTAFVRDEPSLNIKPKLIGAPGMVIELDSSDLSKKITGVELLKERFTYFSKLRTPEELERENERRLKPYTQHLKLKQELENKISEQRSLEWAKRLEADKQEENELNAIRGDTSDIEDNIDFIEKKLEDQEEDENEKGDLEEEDNSSSEDELIEDDVLIKDKQRKKNPLLDQEAAESDAEDSEQNDEVEDNDGDVEDKNVEHSSSDSEDSSESENEEISKRKKGRILKAFEDSDEEIIDDMKNTIENKTTEDSELNGTYNPTLTPRSQATQSDIIKLCENKSKNSITESQDDDIQLAQVSKVSLEELMPTQVNVQSSQNACSMKTVADDTDLGSQTFSILNTGTYVSRTLSLDNLELDTDKAEAKFQMEPYDTNLGSLVENLSGNCIGTQSSQSQPIGEDILAMCTGKFYDNEFVSPAAAEVDINMTIGNSLENDVLNNSSKNILSHSDNNIVNDEAKDATQLTFKDIGTKCIDKQEDILLKSMLDELNEPEFEKPKPLKYFFDETSLNKENEKNSDNVQFKKKFVIDSDDDNDEENNELKEATKKKKSKRKKLEKRALKISDDEEEPSESDDLLSEYEDQVDEEEKLVEYDSEENEVEVQSIVAKKKRKANEFFEQEAELSSEDEWAGSGDEDEAGLDILEREAGDDDTFHQGRLQRELGQIHMRDVLDQDKREVRIIQELLFEDGDLGGGGRQRKFRWRNADGDEEAGTVVDALAESQEEEFESEEQWRKQRHEREMFLRQLKNEDKNEELNVSVSRTTIIKANLSSRTMSHLLEEASSKMDKGLTVVPEKVPAQDIPSPKKHFPVFQGGTRGSMLGRGARALERLAALAAPRDAPAGPLQPAAGKNFVFATLTQPDPEPQITKRKADVNVGTPRLVKKMKIKETKRKLKNSLLDHLEVLN